MIQFQARKLLDHACKSHHIAHVEAIRRSKHLKDVCKVVELLQIQEAIARARRREARRHVGIICGALDLLGIPEIPLSGEEDFSMHLSCGELECPIFDSIHVDSAAIGK